MSDAEPSGTHFPADEGLELSLLGAILLNPENMDRIDFLDPSDFFYVQHRKIYAIMREFWQDGTTPIDPMMISDRDLDLLGICVRAQEICPVGASVYAEIYARRIKDFALKRGLMPMLNTVAEKSMNGVAFESIREFILSEMDSDERRGLGNEWKPKSAADLVEPPAPREWLLEGMLYRGQITMFFGPPGIRKTLLLMDMCAALCLGQNWLTRAQEQPDHSKLTTFHTTRPARILWLDYDNGEFETAIRIRAAMTARGGLGQSGFHYLSEASPWLALDNPNHIRRLIRMAEATAADVIVIDALGMVLGGVDENAPEVASVIAKLKEIRAATGAAILVVHHPSKSGSQTVKANTYNAAGSAKFSNFFEWTIELRPSEEAETMIVDVVKHRGWAKAKKFAARFDYAHFGGAQTQLAHELESFRFYPAPMEGKTEQRENVIAEIVLALLAQGAHNQSDLIKQVKDAAAARLGAAVGKDAVREKILAMATSGAIREQKGGNGAATVYTLES